MQATKFLLSRESHVKAPLSDKDIFNRFILIESVVQVRFSSIAGLQYTITFFPYDAKESYLEIPLQTFLGFLPGLRKKP